MPGPVPDPLPVPPFVFRLPADIAARIRATAARATPPRIGAHPVEDRCC